MITTERIAELRRVEVFSALSDDQLRWFLDRAEERCYEAGDTLSQVGDAADRLMVVLEGSIQGHNRQTGSQTGSQSGSQSGADSIVFLVESGNVAGALPFSRMKTFPATIRAIEATRVLLFHRDHFPALYIELPELIPKLVGILTDRVRETAKAIAQQDKLASPGKLSAGLAHELNSPAAARQASLSARRAFEQFQLASDGFLSLHPTEVFLQQVRELESVGVIEFESQPGCTVFSIRLPLQPTA